MCLLLQWWAQEFAHLLPRMEFVVGDMFKPSSLPSPRPGARTLYVLKQILHDWSDADSLAILRAIRAAVTEEVGITTGVAETVTVKNMCRSVSGACFHGGGDT